MFAAPRIKVDGPLACHLWQGATSPRGYPVLRIDGKVRQVRRVVYERERRPLQPNETVVMDCQSRQCVRGDHMRARLKPG